MNIPGRVENGVVVLESGLVLPEGAAVTVSIPALASVSAAPLPETEIVREPGKLPFVRGGARETWFLTNDEIAQIFDEEDGMALKDMMGDPS